MSAAESPEPYLASVTELRPVHCQCCVDSQRGVDTKRRPARKRAKKVYETPDYAKALGRWIDSYGVRIADGNPEDLAMAGELQHRWDVMMGEAVRGWRGNGYSWAAVGRAFGITRQAAQQRYGKG